MLKHYVEYYYPGALFAETEIEEIKSRKDSLEIPDACFGYSFFDVEETTIDGETLRGKPKNRSGMTYFGKKYTVSELKKLLPNEKVLISNIEDGGYSHAVKTRLGNWQVMNKEDVVIENW